MCVTVSWRRSCIISCKVPSSLSSGGRKNWTLEVKWQFWQRGKVLPGRRVVWTQKSYCYLSFKEWKWVFFEACPDLSVLCLESCGRWRNKCGPQQNFQFINMDIGKCMVVSNISIWTSCFPLLDEQQCVLGDKPRCHVFFISAVDITAWIPFNSNCVPSWEGILFKCLAFKMKLRWELEGRWPRKPPCRTSATCPHGGLHLCLSPFSEGPGSEIITLHSPSLCTPTCTSYPSVSCFLGEENVYWYRYFNFVSVLTKHRGST